MLLMRVLLMLWLMLMRCYDVAMLLAPWPAAMLDDAATVAAQLLRGFSFMLMLFDAAAFVADAMPLRCHDYFDMPALRATRR